MGTSLLMGAASLPLHPVPLPVVVVQSIPEFLFSSKFGKWGVLPQREVFLTLPLHPDKGHAGAAAQGPPLCSPLWSPLAPLAPRGVRRAAAAVGAGSSVSGDPLVAQRAVVLAPKNRAGEAQSCSLVHSFFSPCAPEQSTAWRCFCWEFLVFFLLHTALVSTASVPFPHGLCCCLQPLPPPGHSQSLSGPQQFLSPHFRAALWWSLGALLPVPPFSLQMEPSPPVASPSSARAVS